MVHGQEGPKVHLSAKAISRPTRVEGHRDREAPLRELAWCHGGHNDLDLGDVGLRPSSDINTLGARVRLCPTLQLIP